MYLFGFRLICHKIMQYCFSQSASCRKGTLHYHGNTQKHHVFWIRITIQFILLWTSIKSLSRDTNMIFSVIMKISVWSVMRAHCRKYVCNDKNSHVLKSPHWFTIIVLYQQICTSRKSESPRTFRRIPVSKTEVVFSCHIFKEGRRPGINIPYILRPFNSGCLHCASEILAPNELNFSEPSL